ncbi:succinyldiaminopimelate transaminase [Neisseria meningitidis]|nr:succinyldiaminopimelate transaminase [Neisseria meningitidis]
MNTLLNQLKPYPFARLREAMQGISAPKVWKPSHCISANRNIQHRKSLQMR